MALSHLIESRQKRCRCLRTACFGYDKYDLTTSMICMVFICMVFNASSTVPYQATKPNERATADGQPPTGKIKQQATNEQ